MPLLKGLLFVSILIWNEFQKIDPYSSNLVQLIFRWPKFGKINYYYEQIRNYYYEQIRNYYYEQIYTKKY